MFNTGGGKSRGGGPLPSEQFRQRAVVLLCGYVRVFRTCCEAKGNESSPSAEVFV